MYILIVSNGAPPTVDTKYEFVQSEGKRLLSSGNSNRKYLDVAPSILDFRFWILD
jgi:hypothetical protein